MVYEYDERNEYDDEYNDYQSTIDRIIRDTNARMPDGVEVVYEEYDEIVVKFAPDTPKNVIYQALNDVEQEMDKVDTWPVVIMDRPSPDGGMETMEFQHMPHLYGWVDNNTSDSRNSGTYITFTIDEGMLIDEEGNTAVPDSSPINSSEPFAWNPNAHPADSIGGYYFNEDEVREVRNIMSSIGMPQASANRLAFAKNFVDATRWNPDLSKRVVELAMPDYNYMSDLAGADIEDIQYYMDLSESSGNMPGATSWKELIVESRSQGRIYQGGGDFPPIRTISGFEETATGDPIDLSDLPGFHDVTGRRPIDPAVDIDLPTVTGGSGLTPDLDDLRSEIDKFKEERPKINREEYRGGQGRDSGYRQRRGRGRMT